MKKLLGVMLTVIILSLWIYPTSTLAAKFIKVVMNNKTVSGKALNINNDIYVPARDVAKLLSAKLKYDKKKATLTIVKIQAGQAETKTETHTSSHVPLASKSGKIAQWISNGRTKLIVDRLEYANSYDGYEPLEVDNRFIVLYISQQNASDKDGNIGFDTEKSYLEDVSKDTYPPYLFKNATQISAAPNDTFSSELVFSIPNSAIPSVLILKMIGPNEESIRVSLR